MPLSQIDVNRIADELANCLRRDEMPLSQIDVNRVADEVVRRLRKYDQLEFVRPAHVMKLLGCKKSYLYKLISTRKDFPRSYTMPDSRVKVWRKSEIEEWAAKEYGISRS